LISIDDLLPSQMPFEGVVRDVNQHFYLGTSCRTLAGNQIALVELIIISTEAADGVVNLAQSRIGVVGIKDSEYKSTSVPVNIQNSQIDFIHPLVEQRVLPVETVPVTGILHFLEGAVCEVPLGV